MCKTIPGEGKRSGSGAHLQICTIELAVVLKADLERKERSQG